MKNNLSKILGLKMLRVSDVHEVTGINRTLLSDLYYQRPQNPKFLTLIKICDFLQVPLSELIEYDPRENGDATK